MAYVFLLGEIACEGPLCFKGGCLSAEVVIRISKSGRNYSKLGAGNSP
jgi:hypothetical protein